MKNPRWTALLLACLAAFGPGASAAAPAPAAATAPSVEISTAPKGHPEFTDLCRDYWETQMRLWPLWATFIGRPGPHDRLDDNTAGGRQKELDDLKAILGRLAGIPLEELSDQERLSAEVLRHEIRDRRGHHRHRFHQIDVDHMDGPQSWIPTVLETAQPMKTGEDAEAFLRRLRAVGPYFNNHIANLSEGMAQGRIAARIAVEKTVRQLKEMLAVSASSSPFASAGDRLPGGLKKTYRPRVEAAVAGHVRPGLKNYLHFLESAYLPRARGDDKPGLLHVPGGPEAYRYLVRHHTTLEADPDELHEKGLAELGAIHSELAEVAKRLGHTGDLQSFYEKVRSDPANFFKTREEVLQAAQDLVAGARARLPEFFGTLPKSPLEVRPVETYKEKNEAAARYFPPPEDLSRPGIYFINTYDPPTRPRFAMASLAAHEGVPGHHLQIAIAQERTDLPDFRRHAGFTAYVEGWALYSERLADEMGLYKDDLSRVGMLGDQAFRAARLVVDTGLHHKGWTREAAIRFMKDNLPMSEAEIVSEVDRYIIWPGQALAYKVGQMEILRLRRELESREGKAFSLKAFHDALLASGPLPLPDLARRLNAEDPAGAPPPGTLPIPGTSP